LHGRADNARGTSNVVVQRFRQVGNFRGNVSRQLVEPGKIGKMDVGFLVVMAAPYRVAAPYDSGIQTTRPKSSQHVMKVID
jgi:hypothetical protein